MGRGQEEGWLVEGSSGNGGKAMAVGTDSANRSVAGV